MTEPELVLDARPARSVCKRAAALLLIAMIAGSRPAMAVTPGIVLYLPPTAPLLRSPTAGATTETDYNDARPTFVWRQGGGVYFGYPRPAAPTHFAVCIYDAAVTTTCTYATSAWQPSVGSIPAVPTGSFIDGTAGQYEYTFKLPTAVGPALLDKAIRWSVGACVVASGAGTCTFAPPVDLWLSTKNIVGDSISTSSSNGRNLYFEGIAKNTGTTSIAAPIKTVVEIYNTLMTPGQLCLKDPNSELVQPTDQVVTTIGRRVTVSTLSLDSQNRRVPPADGVAAIYRPTMWHSPSFLAQGNGIPPGASRSIFAFNLQVANTQPVPAAYTAIMQPDYFNDVREPNENDNAKAQCHVIH